MLYTTMKVALVAELQSGFLQMPKMGSFEKIVRDFQPLTIVAKLYIGDVNGGPEQSPG